MSDDSSDEDVPLGQLLAGKKSAPNKKQDKSAQGAPAAKKKSIELIASSRTSEIAGVLSIIMAHRSLREANIYLASAACTPAQRKALASLAGMGTAWVGCDQNIRGNVEDLVADIVGELYEPFWFLRSSLAYGKEAGTPRGMYQQQQATKPMTCKKGGRWSDEDSKAGIAEYEWLPGALGTFDAVVHVVQGYAGGSGVHVGGGRVLTCAHVVRSDDDDEEEGGCKGGGPWRPPKRVGRRRLVMFPSGRTFVSECSFAQETEDGSQDVAVLMLGAEVSLDGLSWSNEVNETSRLARKRKSGEIRAVAALPSSFPTFSSSSSSSLPLAPLPVAVVASDSVELGASLFCVGNPSKLSSDLLLKAWHSSVGHCEGFLDRTANTRGLTGAERAALTTPAAQDAGRLDVMQHSCYTCWGHSGAPLFDYQGRVVGLHCAWDPRTGARFGQKLEHLSTALRSAGGTGEKEATKGKKHKSGEL